MFIRDGGYFFHSNSGLVCFRIYEVATVVYLFISFFFWKSEVFFKLKIKFEVNFFFLYSCIYILE